MWWSTLPGRAPSAWIHAPRSIWCAAGGPRGGASTPCRTPGCSTGCSTAASRWRTDPGRWMTLTGSGTRCAASWGMHGSWLPFFSSRGRQGGSGAIPVPAFVMVALMVGLSMFIAPEWNRSPARLKHVAPWFGELPVTSAPVAWDVPRERVTARSTLTWATLFLGITATASVVAALLAPKVLLTSITANSPDMGPGFGWFNVVAPMGGHRVVAVAILLVALGVGVLGAVAVRRRLGRLLGERPDQPYRALRSLTASGKAGVLFWALLIVALVWLEVSGQIVLGLSVAPGTVALLLLPGALVALLVTRCADAHDLAGRDVWQIATRGRVPRVDQPVRGLRAQPGPVPGSVQVQPSGPTDPPPATP